MNYTDSIFHDEKIKYFSIDVLDKTNLVHAFYTTNDTVAWKMSNPGYKESYEKLSEVLGVKPESMCTTDQTHTDIVRVVSKKEAGEGVTRALELREYDALVTDEKGLLLCSFEADCVPVYFLDPVKKTCGIVHSGWRGTAKMICKNAVSKFTLNYESDPADLIAVIGPCACKKCYEVGSELIEEFKMLFGSDTGSFFIPRDSEKYLLDLEKAIEITLLKCGLSKEKIFTVSRCTIEDEKLCSFRRTHQKKEHMLTAIMLK